MAIPFARIEYVSRSSGGSAVRSSAYIARDAIVAERTGELFYFKNRDAPEHHEVLLPQGAAERFAEAGVLWNAAEAAEKRKDAQVAREMVVALPADAGVTTEDRIAMVRSFAEQHFVSKGLAVQLDVHAPHGADTESERANWHAHLLITTRRIEGDELSANKARDLDPEVRTAGGRARVADGAAWGELWGAHQEKYFREHGLDARVDTPATHAQEHIGPVRMRRAGSQIVERADTIRQANQEAARDPDQVLAALTRNNATFTERDLDRFLAKQLGQEGKDAAEEIASVRAAVLKSRDLVPLHDRETGEAAGRFTTRQVREEERTAMAAAGGLARQRSGAVSEGSARAAEAARTLRPDQVAAYEHAIGAGHLKLIEGRAGTGKSYTLAAIRDAHERDGKRVVGLAPTNAVAQDLAADGFAESGTVHSALFRLKNGRTSWDRNTVVVVDEAAMLDTRVTGELLAAARQAGAKVVLAGDDRQLASIERGGLFSELRQRHGAAEITEVTRQRVDWQRQAARDLAEGRFAEAVGAFDKAGAITWTQDQAQAKRALVAAWKRDGEERPGQSRFVFAYTNKDVDALNAELRQVCRERGELTGADVRLDTKHGAAMFAVGDRVQFTDTDKKLRIYNGNVGTITGLDARTGQMTATLDAAGGRRREVTWSAAEFEGFRHGYAGTIYKGQGKTLDRTYLYHTEHWRSAASYVALTRQRESAQVFVARETARDAGQLARQMARGEVRAASIAWAAPDELPRARQEQRQAEQPEASRPADRDRTAAADPSRAYWQSLGRPAEERDEDSLRAKVRDAQAARQQANARTETPIATPPPETQRQTAGRRAPEAEQAPPVPFHSLARAEPWALPPAPLLPAWRDPAGQGRDSLGRGLDAGSVAAVVAGDGAVRREREAHGHYLQGAYREPLAARAALHELVKQEGWAKAAQAVARDPAQFGELRGKEGWLASGKAKQERAHAERVAGALPDSLRRIGGAEDAARRIYVSSVEEQRARDAIEIPGLSRAAKAALHEVQVAITASQGGRDGERYDDQLRRREEAIAGAWAAGRSTPEVTAELDRFMAAAGRRLGEEGIREASRAASSGHRMTVPGAGQEHQAGLEELARSYTLGRKATEHSAAWGQRVAREMERAEERQRLGLPPEQPGEKQRRGLGMGR